MRRFVDWCYIEFKGGKFENDLRAMYEIGKWPGRFIDYVRENVGMPSEDGFGVFSREEDSGPDRVHRLYFTPQAAAWGAEFGAQPCNKPELSKNLLLTTGTQSAWRMHYPER